MIAMYLIVNGGAESLHLELTKPKKNLNYSQCYFLPQLRKLFTLFASLKASVFLFYNLCVFIENQKFVLFIQYQYVSEYILKLLKISFYKVKLN